MKAIHELALKQALEELKSARKLLYSDDIKRGEIGISETPASNLCEHLNRAEGWVKAIQEDQEP
jgi:hypothetical protein